MYKNKEFQTNSFYLACFLAAKGPMQLLRVDRPAGSRHADFVFSDTDTRKSLVEEFSIGNDSLVNVKDFIFQIRRLKSALYDGNV